MRSANVACAADRGRERLGAPSGPASCVRTTAPTKASRRRAGSWMGSSSPSNPSLFRATPGGGSPAKNNTSLPIGRKPADMKARRDAAFPGAVWANSAWSGPTKRLASTRPRLASPRPRAASSTATSVRSARPWPRMTTAAALGSSKTRMSCQCALARTTLGCTSRSTSTSSASPPSPGAASSTSTPSSRRPISMASAARKRAPSALTGLRLGDVRASTPQGQMSHDVAPCEPDDGHRGTGRRGNQLDTAVCRRKHAERSSIQQRRKPMWLLLHGTGTLAASPLPGRHSTASASTLKSRGEGFVALPGGAWPIRDTYGRRSAFSPPPGRLGFESAVISSSRLPSGSRK
jgi:hypothetical protein